MTAWKPGQHQAMLAMEKPYDYVAPHQVGRLNDWVFTILRDDVELLDYVTNHFRMATIGDVRAFDGAASYEALRALKGTWDRHANFLLSLIEAILPRMDEYDERLETLATILETSNSLFEINEDKTGLRERIDPAVTVAVSSAVSGGSATSAGQHLTAAWNAAYGMTKDAGKAYGEAIKAVEAAAVQTLEPRNHKATLGSMSKVIQNKPDQWRFAIEGDGDRSIERLHGMMLLLWEGQTSRHGGLNPTRPETDSEAQTAVLLSATLCQWFQSRAVTKR